MLGERGMDLRMKYGYIPCDLFNEAVAYDMEYAFSADWAVAQVAAQRGDTADYDYFLDRSKSYRHFFDPETRFMRGLDSKGDFRTPFNPFASTHREDDYCEGNAWQQARAARRRGADRLLRRQGGFRRKTRPRSSRSAPCWRAPLRPTFRA